MFGRYTASLALALFALCAVACSKIPADKCRVVLCWEGASADMLPSRLYLVHNDTLGASVIDTIEMAEEEGKQQLDIYLDTTYSRLEIRPENTSWELAFEMPRATKVTVDVDWAHPHLLRVSGYPEADVRSDFIRSERKLLRRYDEALSSASMAEADSLWALVRHRLAEYIVDNKEKAGCDALMMEFLPGREGVLFFRQCYPNESLPEHFRFFHDEWSRWTTFQENGRSMDWALLPLPDSLRRTLPTVLDSVPRYTIVELLSTSGASPYASEIAKLQKTGQKRFTFLSYSLAAKGQNRSLPSGKGRLPNYYAIPSPAGSILHFADQMGVATFPYYLVVDSRHILVAWGEDFSVLVDSLNSLP